MTHCPHCRKPMVLRQGRLLTPEGAEKFDSEREEKRRERTLTEAKQRFREGRKNAAQEIRQARQSGVVVGFRPLVSEDACRICQEVRKSFFPIGKCKSEMLPPYENCEFEDGCRETFTQVLDTDFDPTTPSKRKSRPKQGCLGVVVVVCILSLIAVSVINVVFT